MKIDEVIVTESSLVDLHRGEVSGINNMLASLIKTPSVEIMDTIQTAVISDLGNVLIHFDNLIFFERLAEFCPFSSVEISEWAGKQRDLYADFDCGRIGARGFFQAFRKRLRVSLKLEKFFSIYSDIFSLNHAAVAVMKRLSADTPLIMLSNTDPVRFDFIRERFPELMFFHEYVLSYEEGCMKPDPRIYQRAVFLSGLQAESCVFIDDRAENIIAAEKIGLRSILFSSDTDLEEELKRQGLKLQP